MRDSLGRMSTHSSFRYLFSIAALVTGVDSALPGQATQLQPQLLDDQLLVRILNSAVMQNLNALQPSLPKALSLRLYAVPVQGPCVRHTHWICSYEYYLAVSEHDEAPAQAVYSLGDVGEIVSVRWMPGTVGDRAILRVSVTNYSMTALRRESTLRREERRFTVDVTVDTLSITEANRR